MKILLAAVFTLILPLNASAPSGNPAATHIVDLDAGTFKALQTAIEECNLEAVRSLVEARPPAQLHPHPCGVLSVDLATQKQLIRKIREAITNWEVKARCAREIADIDEELLPEQLESLVQGVRLEALYALLQKPTTMLSLYVTTSHFKRSVSGPLEELESNVHSITDLLVEHLGLTVEAQPRLEPEEGDPVITIVDSEALNAVNSLLLRTPVSANPQDYLLHEHLQGRQIVVYGGRRPDADSYRGAAGAATGGEESCRCDGRVEPLAEIAAQRLIQAIETGQSFRVILPLFTMCEDKVDMNVLLDAPSERTGTPCREVLLRLPKDSPVRQLFASCLGDAEPEMCGGGSGGGGGGGGTGYVHLDANTCRAELEKIQDIITDNVEKGDAYIAQILRRHVSKSERVTRHVSTILNTPLYSEDGDKRVFLLNNMRELFPEFLATQRTIEYFMGLTAL